MSTAANPRAAALSASPFVLPLAAPVDLLALHAYHPARYPHLLQSVAQGTAQARHDILFAFPGATLEQRAEGTLWRDGQLLAGQSFLSAFDAEWRACAESAMPCADAGVPFSGGWFVFLAYETVAEIEPRLSGVPRCADLPVAIATRFPAALIRDHAANRCYVVCEPGAEQLAPIIAGDAQRAVAVRLAWPQVSVPDVVEEPGERFLAALARVQEYIAAGDVFQVNLSRRWHASLEHEVTPAALYARLRQTNPAPFAALATFGPSAIISSSPERLVEVRGRRIHTRPIAGTHPRSADAAQDAALARALRRHPKERAEHVMLIDLERNDLGRLCRPGSVQVAELMTLESYRHVHHIVSEITGMLRDEVRPTDVLRAVFPGGTITGCPKVRCMEIIQELEAAPRGAYTGSLGYINHDGSMDFNILIRTITQSGRELSLRAGAGIVADSHPQRELAETRAKARGLLDALGAV